MISVENIITKISKCNSYSKNLSGNILEFLNDIILFQKMYFTFIIHNGATPQMLSTRCLFTKRNYRT